MLGVKVISEAAFNVCKRLTGVEFGDKLETIENQAFQSCKSLKYLKMPSVRTIGAQAFKFCYELSDVECGEGLETMVT